MRILIYAHRNDSEAALLRADALRAEGHTALYRDTRGFAGDIEACDRVLTDDAAVAGAHRARGIEVLPFAVADPADKDDAAPEPAPAKPKASARRTRRTR